MQIPHGYSGCLPRHGELWFTSCYIDKYHSRLDPQPSGPGYLPSSLERAHLSSDFTCTSALLSTAILSHAGLWGPPGSVEQPVQHLVLSIFLFPQIQGVQSGNFHRKLMPSSTFYIKDAYMSHLNAIPWGQLLLISMTSWMTNHSCIFINIFQIYLSSLYFSPMLFLDYCSSFLVIILSVKFIFKHIFFSMCPQLTELIGYCIFSFLFWVAMLLCSVAHPLIW